MRTKEIVAHLLWTCVIWDAISVTAESACSEPPKFHPSTSSEIWGTQDSTVILNCTVLLAWNSSDPSCDARLQWLREGALLNASCYTRNTTECPHGNQTQVTSMLQVNLLSPTDFGVYICVVRNASLTFSIHKKDPASHTATVVAAITLLLLLACAALLYSRCHLNCKLWYKNTYGDYEINDGKMYDAYISYVNDENDRKFVNFILKPHLENKYGYKLLLNHTDILPGAEPSAELVMSLSRCRRLIVVLSQSYLQQEWCSSNFRQGLWHLLELSQKPIFITLEAQQKQLDLEVAHQLREHQHREHTLIWGPRSMTPSSSFWKELALVMPRKVTYPIRSSGDPQTLFQDDKDPMLTLRPDYLDCRPDPDPAGDLGLRLPVYKTQLSKAPVLPVAPGLSSERRPSDIDVSDLGLRNYAARTDFYCLVTHDDI
ncbi:single Ig IL-1-related receptor [Clupea harengus]|uniref:Single Ig IL-1-related receptor n=1 Tax=Clupea harengus TaxID=7950 RepID=A0A6P8F5W4_CLUHA|nr:single Ig IL-1-related receptor [Clupea harengus]XP_031420359.1 single Ig IL-1-related receptor [Clupea harengus]XP_031420360.1 single Ig IL-1-related receptor [Clupea harengus]XP_031420361.1 single Ig IL-1-related receptor [Clupea harengus]